MTPRPRGTGRSRLVLLTALLALLGILAADPVAGAQAPAGIARSGSAVSAVDPANPTNPLAGGRWGVYTGSADGVYPAYQRATGTAKTLLGRIALRPRVRWFGGWMSPGDAAAKIRDYITTTQAGDPDVLVQLAVFRLWPRGEGAKNQPLTTADQAAYRQWVDAAAQAIGGARVAMVLEPDLAVSLGGWQPQVRQQLTAYAAHVFAQLPRTAVYLDASDSDWLTVPGAADLLLHSGIGEVRGFALGATHYSSTVANIDYGNRLVAALAQAGAPGKHFVIDTADNGRPFTWLQYRAAHPRGDFDNAQACRTKRQKRCDTLGIPPTSDVAAPQWGIPPALAPAARTLVDGYLWFGRPWLYRQASPFLKKRALQVARTTPY